MSSFSWMSIKLLIFGGSLWFSEVWNPGRLRSSDDWSAERLRRGIDSTLAESSGESESPEMLWLILGRMIAVGF